MSGESTTCGVMLVQNNENSLAGRLERERQTSQSTTTWSGETPQSEAGHSLSYDQDDPMITSYTPAPSKRSNRGKAGAEAKLSSCEPSDSQKTWTYEADYNTQRQDIDFTSDDITELGATLYEQEPVTSWMTPPQSSPGQNPTASTPPASAAPLREADVTVLLRHIQNALGMPTAYTPDSGRGSQAELHNLQDIQRRAIKQEMSGKRQQKRKGKEMPR